MTSRKERWVSSLTELLLEEGWESVRSSKELMLGDAAQAVSQEVDMVAGTWAEVSLGNGVHQCTLN